MSKKDKKKNLAEQEHKGNLKQQEMEAVYEMGYKKGQRLRGFLEILAGVLILCLGLWLWSRTWGTMLLFTNADTGRLARYYWIVLIIAVVILSVGFLTMRKVRVEKKTEDSRKEDEDGTFVKQKTADDKEETLILHNTAATEDGEQQNVPGVEKADAPDQMIPAVPEKEKAEVLSSEILKMTDNQCPGCGKDKKTGAAFCIYCGYKFQSE